MGLDMYLKASKFIGYGQDEKKAAIKAITGSIGKTDSDWVVVEINAAYWRKANAIHKWFVDNVQDGEDDCKDYDVSREQLIELRDLCNRVLEVAKVKKSKVHSGTTYKDGKEVKEYEDGEVITNSDEIEELLPTVGGFFFGNTEYNTWYLDDLRETVRQIDAIINDPKFGEWSFSYRSSW